MLKSLKIKKDTEVVGLNGKEVVGLDGKHVGTVDHLETADRIILSKDDPKAHGRHHLISIDWVDYVDQKAVNQSNIGMADGCLSLVFRPRNMARPLLAGLSA